ncbi:aspartyl-phosphate phosphatase Spo0E family protein [Lentibacillus sp. Marseille-P4043]|uniref:aspartyl-phosphate phosphatase Spo0E family protein n=1 Tax=Lentibacillus sp. Marseille-P4043 TaxID=2040293 RepID=UPI000D0BE898|nr:aspartyl-phosphate phosphatase Spo0E family protein [Lentibacillus sp. Marseille-P4043]
MITINRKETTGYLLKLINRKRKMMVKAAKKFGIDSKKTLKCSQELDELIIKYQRMVKSEGQGTS